MSIICVSGSPGAGKTALAKAIAAKLAMNYGSFGDYVRHCAALRRLPADRKSLQRLGQHMVSEGVPAFCASVLKWLNWAPSSELILEGLRHEAVLDALAESVRPVPVRLLFVDVSRALQLSRLRSRRTEPEASAIMADVSETDVQTVLRSRADFVVSGDDPLDLPVAHAYEWIRTTLVRQDADDEPAKG